ncbi:uncharacterized protein LOC116665086 [Camelus ferus]|uniref:Uncharacterized protein LOC116665086 n=1 Tax=Camelus ferus TaxID=419612 RepID=A0A8B8TDE8_CAMFR|nr:uncharacterized protein LOC116665086 [Camelus ferus]
MYRDIIIYQRTRLLVNSFTDFFFFFLTNCPAPLPGQVPGSPSRIWGDIFAQKLTQKLGLCSLGEAGQAPPPLPRPPISSWDGPLLSTTTPIAAHLHPQPPPPPPPIFKSQALCLLSLSHLYKGLPSLSEVASVEIAGKRTLPVSSPTHMLLLNVVHMIQFGERGLKGNAEKKYDLDLDQNPSQDEKAVCRKYIPSTKWKSKLLLRIESYSVDCVLWSVQPFHY